MVLKLMAGTKIDGPHDQRAINLIGKHLGSGTQFDVYGHQHVTRDDFPSFDQPFVSSRVRPLPGPRPVVVAIKRPRFKLSFGDDKLESAASVGFGTPAQLQALELEIRTLCNDSIRSHRNIVKLLAWGLEDVYSARSFSVEPLSPFLVVEHGNYNVLVFPDQEGPFFCVAKLSDFGLSVIDQKEKIFDIGTPGWQAPELPSNEGIGSEMLVKCDYFSLGLVIFSTIVMRGAPPAKASSVTFTFELAKIRLAQSNIPPSAADRISCALETLLHSNPSDRPSDLENICHILKNVEESVFDSRGNWVNGRFDDNTPWGELLNTNSGKTMILGSYSHFSSFMIQSIPSDDAVSISWQEIHIFLNECPGSLYNHIATYYIENIDAIIIQRTQDENLSKEILGQDITGHQLLGLCFNDRLPILHYRLDANTQTGLRGARRQRASCAVVAATKGYFPAQAVASKLLNDTGSKLLKVVHDNDTKWQWNAVSTGYILAWKFSLENPEEHESALKHFRKLGGYNRHYICPLPKGNSNLVYNTSGILRNPLAGLSPKTYPFHYAAVHDDVSGIERLLAKRYLINSTDGIGETALHMACMAGAYNTVRCLIKNGADPTIKSKRLGTVPLHWLFLFEPDHVHEIARLLTSTDKSVLNQLSDPDNRAFHFPFSWPVGTPLAWAVLSNRAEAVNSLLELGSTLESITDFFPGPHKWSWSDISAVNFREGGNDDPYRKLWSFWIYHDMEKYRLPVVQQNLSYQKQLNILSSVTAPWAQKQTLAVFGTFGNRLNTAVEENDFDFVKQLIEQGADVNRVVKNQYGEASTPLMAAIAQRNPDIVQLLLNKGAIFDGPDYPNLETPLLWAVQRRHLGIIEMLLQKGAKVNTQSTGNYGHRGTALFEAASRGLSEIAKLLLQYNTDPLVMTEGHGNCLEGAAYSNNAELVELFLKAGADPNTPGKISEIGNAIQQAAHHGNAKILRSLLERGGDPNIRGGQYETALQAAINPSIHRMWKHQTHVVRLLLEKGADATVEGGKYGSIMQAAACSTDFDLAKLLLDAGAPLDIGGGPHGSALQAAVSWTDDLKLMQLLLDHGADPNFGAGEKFDSALSLAVKKGNEKQVELLLRRGAHPNGQDGLHGNASKPAVMPGNTRISQMLLDWGPRDNAELDQWNSLVAHTSHPNIASVRVILSQRFEKSKRNVPGVLSSVELAEKVIDFAEYWLAELAQRHEQLQLSKDTIDTPYLQVNVKSWPSADTRVQRIIFRIKSHKVEPVNMPELPLGDLNDNSSHPWLEVGVRSKNSTSSPNQTPLIAERIFCSSLTTRTHNTIWDLNNNFDLQISKVPSGLEPGDTVDLYVKSQVAEEQQVNYVDSAEVIIFYSYKTPSRQVSFVPKPTFTRTFS
ncbi:hypothetical protein RUND412_006504 [Rhizina undulata]